MSLALGHGLESFLSLDLEVIFAGEAGEKAKQDGLTGLLLIFEAAAKILIREKRFNIDLQK